MTLSKNFFIYSDRFKRNFFLDHDGLDEFDLACCQEDGTVEVVSLTDVDKKVSPNTSFIDLFTESKPDDLRELFKIYKKLVSYHYYELKEKIN